MHKCENHYYDPNPEIDKRLWSVEQWILLSKKRATQPCVFYDNYFSKNGLLAVRVQEARHWLKKIIANLAFLQATLDAESRKKVATPTNDTRANDPALATPTNTTVANDPAPSNSTMVSTSQVLPWCFDTTSVPLQDGLETSTGHASAEIIQTQNNSSSVFPAPSDHNPAMTVPILDSHATSTVASLSTQSEPTPDVVDLPAVVLLTGVSSIWVTPSSQLKQPPDAVPGQPSLQLKPPPGLILEGVARSPITLKKQWQ